MNLNTEWDNTLGSLDERMRNRNYTIIISKLKHLERQRDLECANNDKSAQQTVKIKKVIRLLCRKIKLTFCNITQMIQNRNNTILKSEVANILNFIS